jgi:hypothetical protein
MEWMVSEPKRCDDPHSFSPALEQTPQVCVLPSIFLSALTVTQNMLHPLLRLEFQYPYGARCLHSQILQPTAFNLTGSARPSTGIHFSSILFSDRGQVSSVRAAI